MNPISTLDSLSDDVEGPQVRPAEDLLSWAHPDDPSQRGLGGSGSSDTLQMADATTGKAHCAVPSPHQYRVSPWEVRTEPHPPRTKKKKSHTHCFNIYDLIFTAKYVSFFSFLYFQHFFSCLLFSSSFLLQTILLWGYFVSTCNLPAWETQSVDIPLPCRRSCSSSDVAPQLLFFWFLKEIP